MSWWAAVATILGGSSFIGTVIVALLQRKKVGADAASVLTGSALQIVQDLRSELKDNRAELARTRAELGRTNSELRAVRRHMGALEVLLRERGVPVPEMAWPPAGWPVGE